MGIDFFIFKQWVLHWNVGYIFCGQEQPCTKFDSTYLEENFIKTYQKKIIKCDLRKRFTWASDNSKHLASIDPQLYLI